jgi:DNA-binding NarL/FixJ family response regulator
VSTELLTLTPHTAQSGRNRIMLVEDHAVLREGLRALLELEQDLRIVCESANGIDAVPAVESLTPDLVIIDIALPGRSGIELIGCLRQLRAAPRILVLTAHNSEEYIRAALNAGAHGYVLKDASRAELLQAIRAVLRGDTYLCAAVTAKVVTGYLRPMPEPLSLSALELLTEREREVLRRVALGWSNKLIARELQVSIKTVEKHRANLMRKLTLHNTAAVTRFAIRHGIVAAADLGVPVE